MKVEEKPLGFIESVKAFWKGTDGGAVPVALAATMCGISRERVYQLIKKEIEREGTGLRACKWNNKVLVYVKDIEAYWDRPKDKGGYHAHKERRE